MLEIAKTGEIKHWRHGDYIHPKKWYISVCPHDAIIQNLGLVWCSQHWGEKQWHKCVS